MNRTKYFRAGQGFCFLVLLIVLLPLSGRANLAAENESMQYFKMLSTIEYTGKTQFSHRVETLSAVRKQTLSDDKIRYFIHTSALEADVNTGRQSSIEELSFILDGKTRHLSGGGKDLELFAKVSNQCVRSIKKVTKNNIGKTWKQSFTLALLGDSIPDELNFTLTAISLKAQVFGEESSEMIAVRALSEPFIVNATREDGSGTGPVQSRMSAVYLFDSDIEDIYLSISVFKATTKINGYKEKLRHEVATYKTDIEGVPVALSKLGKKFGKLVQKLGLSKKTLKVKKESALPQWACSDALGAAQVANICAATACEGALNPVAMVFMPAARTVAMQSLGTLASAGTLGAISATLSGTVPAVGGMSLGTAGIGLGTAGAIAGGTVGTVAVAGGGGGGGGGAAAAAASSRSP